MLTRRAICGLPALLVAGAAGGQVAPAITLLAPEGMPNSKVTSLAQQLLIAGIRVSASPGHGPVENVGSLLQRGNAEVAVLPAGVRDYLRRTGLLPQAVAELRSIGPLYDAPVQILAEATIADLTQLAGQRVGCGVRNSVSFVSATELFAAIGLQAQLLPVAHVEALQALRRRDIAAMVLVGEAPTSLLFGVNREQDGLHFLPVVLAGAPAARYPRAELTIQEYPLLIGEGEAGTGAPISTVAVPMLLAAYNWPPGTAAYASLSRFAAAFSRIAPSAAETPDWVRFVPGVSPPVMAGAATNQTTAPAVAQPPASETPQLTTQNPEALFREFEKWLRQQKP